jgi:hypothetical protein
VHVSVHTLVERQQPMNRGSLALCLQQVSRGITWVSTFTGDR